MAEPKEFEGMTHMLGAPTGHEDQIHPLPVHINQEGQYGRVFYSCWQLSPEELAEIARTGVVWGGVWSEGHPPVTVSGLQLVVAKLDS